jgi:hypothetical protein
MVRPAAVLIALAPLLSRADDAVQPAPPATVTAPLAGHQPGDAFTLAYVPLPAGARPQLRIMAPEGHLVRLSDAGAELLRDTIPTAIEAEPGRPLRVEVRSEQGTSLLDRTVEIRAGHVAELSVATGPAPTPTITMTRAPASNGGFAAAANGSGLRPVYVGGPGTGLMLVRGPVIPQPTTPTQLTPTPQAATQPAPAAPREVAPATPTVTTRAESPRPPPPLAQRPPPPPAPSPPAPTPAPAARCLATAEFQALVANVKRAGHDPQRLASLEANVGARELCVAQVIELLGAFGQGVTKLRALPVLAPRITDRDQASRIVETFAFESERREARKALGL